MNIKVSIIVPIYKTQKYLMQCIDSIRNQTLKDIEIILVDEGDDDECYAIMLFASSLDERIVIVHERHGGYGASCNKGIDLAKGEYIGIVESDDFIESQMYEEMYNFAKKNDVDVVKIPFYYFSDNKRKDDGKKSVCDYCYDITKSSPATGFSILEYPQQFSVHASNWAGLYRTAFLKEKNVKFIEAKGASYVDVGFRIDTFLNAKTVGWLPIPLYNYRTSNEDSSTNNFNLTAMLYRWNEAHKKFIKDYPEVYDKIGPFLFIDEWWNTYAYFFNGYDFTEEQLRLAKENLSFIDDEIIKNVKCAAERKKIKVYCAIIKNKHASKILKIWKLKKFVSYLNSQISFGLTHIDISIFQNVPQLIYINTTILKKFYFKVSVGRRSDPVSLHQKFFALLLRR